jgi:hypothetical protein
MSVLDPKSWETDTPRTLDGRAYPERLREYEQYDEQLLPHVQERRPIDFNGLLGAVGSQRLQAALYSWVHSAEWRGLIEPVPGARPPAWVLGPIGRARARAAARDAA